MNNQEAGKNNLSANLNSLVPPALALPFNRDRADVKETKSNDEEELSNALIRKLDFNNSENSKEDFKENKQIPPTPQQNPPLYLDNLPDQGTYIIGCPPVQSSGDIYHILAYLILCNYYRTTLPLVWLAYDTADTLEHAKKAAGLANLLGFQIETVKVAYNNSAQSPVRLAQLREYVKISKTPFGHKYLIDQKATTLFIIRHIQEHGLEKTQKILRDGFTHLAEKCKKEHSKKIAELQKWVSNEIEKIKKSAAGQKIVILNHRFSEHANNDQNITAQDVQVLTNYLQEKNIFLWTLIAASKPENTKLKHATYLFSTGLINRIFGIDKNDDALGFYKLRHILLLEALRTLPNIQYMVGNTSGTLDIAAFMGWRVYDFHSFNKGRYDYLVAQDYRVLMQTWLMKIGYPIRHTQGQISFDKWQKDTSDTSNYPAELERTIDIPRNGNSSPLYTHHQERLPYSGCLTWNTSRNDLERLNKKEDTAHQQYRIFTLMDDQLRCQAYRAKLRPLIANSFFNKNTVVKEEDKNKILSLCLDYATDVNDARKLGI
jgi:hypothetical protein